MTILVNCPLKIEYKIFKEVFQLTSNSSIHPYPLCSYVDSKQILLGLQGGLGKVNTALATYIIASEKKPNLIIDTGSCGAIGDNIKRGDLIFSTRAYEYDHFGKNIPEKISKSMTQFSLLAQNKSFLTKLDEWRKMKNSSVHRGIQAAGEMDINSLEDKKKLCRVFNASGCNWETATVFKVATILGIPALSIRVCSDEANETMEQDFYKYLQENLKKLYLFIKELLDHTNFLQDFYSFY